MANNRMYLCHRPSGKAVYLGKRMGAGWYGAPSDLCESLTALFEQVDEWIGDEHPLSLQDDFAVIMETDAGGWWNAIRELVQAGEENYVYSVVKKEEK